MPKDEDPKTQSSDPGTPVDDQDEADQDLSGLTIREAAARDVAANVRAAKFMDMLEERAAAGIGDKLSSIAHQLAKAVDMEGALGVRAQLAKLDLIDSWKRLELGNLPDLNPGLDLQPPYEEKRREQEQQAKLIAQELVYAGRALLAEWNQATDFPDETRGRTPEFAYAWAYEQIKQGRRRKDVWLDVVTIFLDDPTMTKDNLLEFKKNFDSAIDYRRKKDQQE